MQIVGYFFYTHEAMHEGVEPKEADSTLRATIRPTLTPDTLWDLLDERVMVSERTNLPKDAQSKRAKRMQKKILLI